MKIIDLLVKISKGEEVPKQIKYCGVNYYWTGFNYENSEADEVLFWYCVHSEKYLNNEVEVIEDKKIKRIGKLNQVEDKQNLNNYMLRDKINEIINYINKESK